MQLSISAADGSALVHSCAPAGTGIQIVPHQNTISGIHAQNQAWHEHVATGGDV